MKRLFTFLTAILTILTATAQEEYSIILDKSTFHKVHSDPLSGVNIDPIKKDLSRNPCARLKIKFKDMSRAEVDALSVKFKSNTDIARQEVAQYFDDVLILEVTAKPATRFYVKSPEYGESNEVSVDLEGNCEYEMEARLNKSFSIVVDTNVAEADVYLDGYKKERTDASCRVTIKEVMIGEHTIKVDYKGVTAEQKVVVNGDNISFRVNVNTEASKPQYVVFAVEPQNAVVTIEGTPYPLSDGSMMAVLESGTYNYVVAAAGYHSQSGMFTVAGNKVEKIITLKADAAKVTLTAPDNADIWVNGSKKGSGRWSGTLTSGVYIFEARQAGHRPATMSQKITSDNPNQSYTLPAPVPMVGTLTIGSSPLMADVAVDGKSVGRTPIDINDLLIGEHKVTISKSGYAPFAQTITITEGKTTTVTATLTKQSAPTPTPATPSSFGKTYKVGDYYNENGKKGVVFYVDESGEHGKIVHLKHGGSGYYAYCPGGGTSQSYHRQYYGVDSHTDGEINLYRAKKITDWRGKFTHIAYCADLGSGWYLPAINELEQLVASLDIVNATLKIYGKEIGKKDEKWYWSSTEYKKANGDCCAYGVDLKDRKTYISLKKGYGHSRAIANF